MDDFLFIEHCRKSLQEKVKWGDYAKWSHYNYVRLQENVFASTGVNIGNLTLKRFFGKYHQDVIHHNPQIATKNALAKYLGYTDWEDFKLKEYNNVMLLKSTISRKGILHKIGSFFKSIIIIGLIVAIIIIALFYRMSNSNVQKEKITISTQTPIANAGTIKFNYSIPSSYKNQVYFNHKNNETKIPLDKNKNTFTQNFNLPNHYNIRLITDKDEVLDSIYVLICSPKWFRYIVYVEKNPILLPFQVVNSTITTDISEIGKDSTTNFQSKIQCFNLFNIDGNNFTIETRIKNNYDQKNLIYCNYASIKVYTFNNTIKLNLTEPSCYNRSYFIVSEKNMSGDFANNEHLGMELKQWRTIKIVVKNNEGQLYIDGKFAYKVPYKEKIGNILGLQYQFSRSGSIDYVRIYNENDSLCYNEEFDSIIE
jgi:hypothetical protein